MPRQVSPVDQSGLQLCFRDNDAARFSLIRGNCASFVATKLMEHHLREANAICAFRLVEYGDAQTSIIYIIVCFSSAPNSQQTVCGKRVPNQAMQSPSELKKTPPRPPVLHSGSWAVNVNKTTIAKALLFFRPTPSGLPPGRSARSIACCKLCCKD